nr:M56 family metallopeptidase [uncultured Schaedlerella sp.]
MSLMAMSISGAVLILVILAVRAGLKGRLPKRTFAVLWTVALIRLLIPFSVPSSWSAYTLLQNAVPETEQVRYFTDMIAGNPSGGAARFGSASWLYGTDTAGGAGNLPGREDGFGEGTGMQSGSGSGAQMDPAWKPQSRSGAGSGARTNAAQDPQSKSGEQSQPDSASGIQSGGQQASSIASDSVSEEKLSFAECFADLLPILRGIWAAGFLLCTIAFAWIYFRCCREFQMSLPMEDCFLENWQRTHPLRRRLSIRQSDQILSPLSYGFWRPVILLPKSTKCGDRFQLRYVLEHEYVHIRYFDAAVKLLMAAALCIHWFNPCVYLMYIFFNRDLELACDEAVVRRFGEEEKSAYAMALIEMEEEKSGLLPLGNSFSKNAIEERIGAIMKIKKISPLVHGLSAALVCGITLLFATSCGSYGEAEQTMEAGPRTEAVDAEEAKTNSIVETKSLSAALKESGQYSPTLRSQEASAADVSIAGYSKKELEDQIAAIDQVIEEKEKTLEQVEEMYLAIQGDKLYLDSLTERNQEIQDRVENAGKYTDKDQLIQEREQNVARIQETEEIFFEEHYGRYGIRFDLSEGRLYKGRTPVRFFIDEKEGGVLWADNEGESVVRAVYSEEGKLTGVSVKKAEDSRIGVHIAEDPEKTEAETREKAAEAVEKEVEKKAAEAAKKEVEKKASAEAAEKASEKAAEAAEKEAERVAEATENEAEKATEKEAGEAGASKSAAGGSKENSAEIAAGSGTEYTTDNPYHSAAYMISIGEEFEEYEKFGLSYDKKSDFLMYKDQTIGYFKDETKPGIYTRLVEGSGDLGITVNRDKSGKITDFSVFPFNESSLPDSSVSEDTAVKEGSGIIRWDDSGDIVSIVSFPAKERGSLEAYAAEQENADKAEAASGTAVSSEDGSKTEAMSGKTAYSEGNPNAEKTSLPKEYEKLGVKISNEKNNEWTYQGKGVAVIYDKDHWVYANDTIPEKKAVYLEVVRDKKDRVTELKEITKKEMQKLFDEE